MDTETKTIISPTVINPNRAEKSPSPEYTQEAGLTRVEGGGPIKSPKSDLPKKFGYYFDENALADLALKMDAPPERQQEILRDYAKNVVEAVFKEVRCPESTGVLLNLDYPTDMSVLKGQLLGLMGSLKDMGELAGLGREDFELCQNLIVRIRNEIIRLVEQGLEEKGLERKVGVKGVRFGEGGFGKVFACRLGSKNMAAKFVRKGVKNSFTYHQYPELIEATRENENLVQFSGSLEFSGEESGRLDFLEELPGWIPLDDYWTMREGGERVGGNSLKGYLEDIFLPALFGITALHGHHLLHGDIKTANILVSGGKGKPSVKVGDYDLVRRSGYDSGSIASGSPPWMSPEQFQGKKLTEKTDIFSMGMILYYALGGEMVKDFMGQGHRVMQGLDVSSLDCPKPLRQLVESCLKVEPEQRPTADELIQRVRQLLADPSFEAEVQERLSGRQPTGPMGRVRELDRAA